MFHPKPLGTTEPDLELALLLANSAADERDYRRMQTWRLDRAGGMRPMDSAMADLLPWYMGGAAQSAAEAGTTVPEAEELSSAGIFTFSKQR